LSLAIERCRKLSLAAKLAIGAGAVWLIASVFGLTPFSPALMLAALAAMIGGVVLLGSNKTTWDQTAEALEAAKTQRNALIALLPMRTVSGVTLH
jgi:hypothetical protein